MLLDFWEKYQARLSDTGFTVGMTDLAKRKVITGTDIPLYVKELARLKTVDISDYKFILERLIVFIKHKELKKAIEDAVSKHLPKENFDEIEKAMRAVAEITTFEDSAAYDYYSDRAIDDRLSARDLESRVKTTGISTGIKRMDDFFPKKGWYRRELYTILAPPKRGKTMGLQWFANAAVIQGFTVPIFTLEVSRDIYADRLDACNANIEIKHLPSKMVEARDRVKAMRPSGKMLIFEYPTKRLDCPEIERQLRKLEQAGTPADMLVVDYADIMKPARWYKDDGLREQASIYEDLRALATIFDIPVLTASQVNRAGSNKEIIKGRDTAGTWEKIMVSDAIISLSASDAEMKKGEMKIHFSECRNMESATIKVKTAYNFGRFYKEFVGTVEETD
jgi:replicative DNA helicase